MSQNDLSKLTCRIFDFGLFGVFLGQALGPLNDGFGRVELFTPHESAFPDRKDRDIGRGIPGITRIWSFWENKDSVDTWFFPDIGATDIQQELLSQKRAVFGTGTGVRDKKGDTSAELEWDRLKFKQTLIKQGLAVPKWENVKGIDALVAKAEKDPGFWVKPNVGERRVFETFFIEDLKSARSKLDQIAHDLGPGRDITYFMTEKPVPGIEPGSDQFICNGIALEDGLYGWEQKGDGYVCRAMKLADMPPAVKTVNDAMAPVFKQYGINAAISTEVRQGQNRISYYIDGCFDDQTEILTGEGWKYFKDLNKNEQVATLNIETKKIEYQKPTHYFDYEFNGNLINISNKEKSIECTVTPNHLVLRTDRKKKRLFKERADSLTDKGFIPRTGQWKETGEGFFVLPTYHREWDFIGQYDQFICRRKYYAPEKKIPMSVWSAFLAWYLSEGSLGGSRSNGIHRVVQIAQTVNCKELRNVLDNLGFEYSEKCGQFRILSTQLAEYLAQFGKCSDKYVPSYIKGASSEVIDIFLQNYCLGDGCTHKRDKGRSYFTTSKKMADDIQEMIFKIGHISKISPWNQTGTEMTIRGRSYIRNHNGYVIYESTKWLDFWFETGIRKKKYITEIPYDGKVYCVSVSNATIYVRKNGKPFWSSNCLRFGNPPAASISEIYKNFPKMARGIAHGEIVKPEFKAKYAAEVSVDVPGADEEPVPFELEKDEWRQIKMRTCCRIDGQFWHLPFKENGCTIVKAVGLGKTRDEAQDNALEAAENFKCKGKSFNRSTFEELEKDFAEGEKIGVFRP